MYVSTVDLCVKFDELDFSLSLPSVECDRWWDDSDSRLVSCTTEDARDGIQRSIIGQKKRVYLTLLIIIIDIRYAYMELSMS